MSKTVYAALNKSDDVIGIFASQDQAALAAAAYGWHEPDEIAAHIEEWDVQDQVDGYPGGFDDYDFSEDGNSGCTFAEVQDAIAARAAA